MTSQEIQQYVYDFLYDKSLPHKSIVSVMGNITAESSWNPDMIEVGSGVGFGLCQWSYSRRTQLEAYGTTLQHQCEFLWSELTGENTSVTGADLQWINPPSSAVTGGISFSCPLSDFTASNGTIEFLTSAFCYCWERPAPETNHLESIRIPSALEFNTTMSYQGGGGTDPTDPTDPEDGELWDKLILTPYIINQLSTEQTTFLKTLSFSDSVKIKHTFNKRKYNGVNFTGKRLTIDDKSYIIVDVENNGFIKLTTSLDNKCYKFVNPSLIKEV